MLQAAIAELQQLLDRERQHTHQLQQQLAAKTHTAASQVQVAPSQAAAATAEGDDDAIISEQPMTDAVESYESTSSSQSKADGEWLKSCWLAFLHMHGKHVLSSD